MYRTDVSKPDHHGRTGVTIQQPDKCWSGYTLTWSRQTEHAQLVDMEGRIVHRWEYRQGMNWHFATMLPNGHLLVIPNHKAGQMLLELDWQSNPVWKHPSGSHHDCERLPNGNTLSVCHGRAHYPAICSRPMLYDYLLEITPDHQIAWEWHYATHEEQIRQLVEVPGPLEHYRDWPHINTVESLPDTPLGRADSRFKAGNVLFSPRHCHLIAVIEKESGDVVWAWGPGEILGQHQPTMLPSGNILLFDNGSGPPLRGYSRVLEIEPLSGKIVWQYQSDPPTEFWTPVGSGNQRLPNGNTLICAMNWDETGRVFEVTPAGETVWEYWNPEEQSLYRSERHAPELVEGLLKQYGE